MVQIVKNSSGFQVQVIKRGEVIKTEQHALEGDAICAAKYLSMIHRVPLARQK